MIFDIKVSWFKSTWTNAPGGSTRLLDCLNPLKLADRVSAIRAEPDKAKRDKLKVATMPSFTPSGLFTIRNESGLIHHSGFMCFAVDAKENPHVTDWSEVRDRLQDIPEIAFAALSVSGRGLFFLIQLDTPPKSADAHSAAYKALVPTFEKMTGLKLDATSDVCRLRFMTYDPDAWGWLEPTPVSIPNQHQNLFTRNIFYPQIRSAQSEKPMKMWSGNTVISLRGIGIFSSNTLHVVWQGGEYPGTKRNPI